MENFEKLGVLYLGREHDLKSKKSKDRLVLYDSKDLVTHAVCVGMKYPDGGLLDKSKLILKGRSLPCINSTVPLHTVTAGILECWQLTAMKSRASR